MFLRSGMDFFGNWNCFFLFVGILFWFSFEKEHFNIKI